jgi:hypothetical protein
MPHSPHLKSPRSGFGMRSSGMWWVRLAMTPCALSKSSFEMMGSYSGIMIYDTVSSNVTFVDWRSDKTYHFDTDTNLHITTVAGPASRTYTALTHSSSGLDINGSYNLDDFMISGQNDLLSIAAGTTFIFPKSFTGSDNRAISPDANGNDWLETWGETMTFSEALTKSDNLDNLSSSDVVNIIVAGLQKKGFQND